MIPAEAEQIPMNRTVYRLYTFIATGFGTGFCPLAPGTAGSAACCGVFLLGIAAAGPYITCLRIATGILAVLCAAGCVLLGTHVHMRFKNTDPGQCTLDEWAGQSVVLCVVPLGTGWEQHAFSATAAFVAFRIFDIAKPPPIKSAERLPGGAGIAADDIVAGIAAGALVQLLRLWI